MINLQDLNTNSQIIIYVNTLDPDIPYSNNLFLFGFKSGFGNKWFYVMPTIVVQNTRYTKFSIELTTEILEDPLNGLVYMYPAGNMDYKLWAIDTPTLDPYDGYLLDQGQSFLTGCAVEVEFVTYVSDNEAEENVVYVNDTCGCTVWSTDVDQWQFASQQWSQCN